MARYIYHRCSTVMQDFLQQKNCVDNYLTSVGLDPVSDITLTMTEHVSGTVSHNDRKLREVMNKCRKGDTVYISELSRLGRNMSDLFAIVTECCERGIRIVQCKDGSIIENESIGGKALLFALSLAAEIEVANIRQRTQMGIDVRKKMRDNGETWISNSGRLCSRLGREKGADLSKARAASALARADMAIAWRSQSAAVAFARRKRKEGYTIDQIAAELAQLYDDNQPDDPKSLNPYATQRGCKPKRAVVAKWLAEVNETA